MSRSDDQRVADILEAADELDLVVAVGRVAFSDSVLHIRAAERLLEIIGEASTASPTSSKTPTPKCRGAMSRRSGYCSHTTTTASISTRSGRSRRNRCPNSTARFAQTDDHRSASAGPWQQFFSGVGVPPIAGMVQSDRLTHRRQVGP